MPGINTFPGCKGKMAFKTENGRAVDRKKKMVVISWDGTEITV